MLRMLREQLAFTSGELPFEALPDLDDYYGDDSGPTWLSGVENLDNVSPDTLWENLGLGETKQLPCFNRRYHKESVYNPWEHTEWWTKYGKDRKHTAKLQPRWLQLVGIFRMLQRAFEGKGLLLMDTVGLGKTLQVIGTIAMICWFREYYEKHKRFPGWFGMSLFLYFDKMLNIWLVADKKWCGKEGNIPNLPFMLVTPITLHHQLMSECRRYLKPGFFDIFAYVGKPESRTEFFSSKVWDKSNVELGKRILIASMPVSTYFI